MFEFTYSYQLVTPWDAALLVAAVLGGMGSGWLLGRLIEAAVSAAYLSVRGRVAARRLAQLEPVNVPEWAPLKAFMAAQPPTPQAFTPIPAKEAS